MTSCGGDGGTQEAKKKALCLSKAPEYGIGFNYHL